MRNKGFTLIELIVVIAISALILPVVFNILNFSLKSQDMIVEEFELQSDFRYTAEVTNNSLRFASVGFVVPASQYKPTIVSDDVTGLKKPWNYLGLNHDQTALVQYVYDKDTTKYKTSILAQAPSGVTLRVNFEKADDNVASDKKIVKYILEGVKDGKVVYSLISEVDAISAIHVIDWSDSVSVGVAFAYRTEETPEINKRPVAAMAMVLDTSGSMTKYVDGSGDDNLNPAPLLSRVEIMKDSLEIMIEDLRPGDNVYASLVPFALNANIPHVNFTNSSITNPSDFRKISKIKGGDDWEILIESIKAFNGTNTGDGMRRGYYQLLSFKNDFDAAPYNLPSDTQILNYMVILVDGNTNWYTSGYQLTDGNATSVVGDSTKGEIYINRIGEKLIQAKDLPSGAQNLNLMGNVFVIGFNTKSNEISNVKDIAKSVGISVAADNSDVVEKYINNDRIFVAESASDLEDVFGEIGAIITEDLWQVSGPKLD